MRVPRRAGTPCPRGAGSAGRAAGRGPRLAPPLLLTLPCDWWACPAFGPRLPASRLRAPGAGRHLVSRGALRRPQVSEGFARPTGASLTPTRHSRIPPRWSGSSRGPRHRWRRRPCEGQGLVCSQGSERGLRAAVCLRRMRCGVQGLSAAGLRSLRVTKYCDLQPLELYGGDVDCPAQGQADLGQDGTCLGRDGSCEAWPFCLSLEETFFCSCNPWLAISVVTCSVLSSARLVRSPWACICTRPAACKLSLNLSCACSGAGVASIPEFCSQSPQLTFCSVFS